MSIRSCQRLSTARRNAIKFYVGNADVIIAFLALALMPPDAQLLMYSPSNPANVVRLFQSSK
jgi:hypothetical protein